MNKLHRLYQSTSDLHQRFGTNQSLQSSLDIMQEEYNEVIDHTSSENLKEEIADVIVTFIKVFENVFSEHETTEHAFTALFAANRMMFEVMTIARANGIKPEDVYLYIDKVIGKNNAKSLQTHWLNPETGKIERKPLE